MKTSSFSISIVLLASVFIFHSGKILAQENFQPGYILQNNGDTVYGSIDYRNWEKSPDRILFKAKNHPEPQICLPMTVKGFMVADARYRGAVVQTEVSPVNTDDLTHDPALRFETDTTFLEVLVEGPSELLYYMNEAGNRQFYLGNGNETIFLTYKKYLKDFEGKTIVAENNNFRNQLIYYFNDCSNLQGKISKTSYNQTGLTDLFNAYYVCKQQLSAYQRNRDKTRVTFGLEAGLSLTSIKFNQNDDFDYLSDADFSTSFNPAGGVFLNIRFPRNFGKFSLHNELFINTYILTGSYIDYTNENKYVLTNSTLGFTYMKLNNLFRFSRPVGKNSLFFNAGISNGLCIMYNNQRVVTSKFYTTETVVTKEAVEGARKFELGFIGGLGLQHKDFTFEFRYERSNGMSDFLGLNSTVSRFYVLVGYAF